MATEQHVPTVSGTGKAITNVATQNKVAAFFSGSFPGIPVDHTVHHTLETPADATCWERVRDTVLRFFIRYQKVFTWLACLMAIAFVIDICFIIFAFWGRWLHCLPCSTSAHRVSAPAGAVFGIGIVGANPACNVTGMANVTFEGNNQYPPTVNDEYVAEYCNLNQRMFNVCIKVSCRKLTAHSSFLILNEMIYHSYQGDCPGHHLCQHTASLLAYCNHDRRLDRGGRSSDRNQR